MGPQLSLERKAMHLGYFCRHMDVWDVHFRILKSILSWNHEASFFPGSSRVPSKSFCRGTARVLTL